MSSKNPLEPLQYLKVVKDEAKQEAERTGTENPFLALGDFLRVASPQPSATEGPNPFLALGDFQAGRVTTEDVASPESRFVRGVGRGVVHPVRAFLHKGEKADLGLAGAAGEFLGAGLTFIPLFRGAEAVLGGVGLLRTAELAAGKEMLYLAPFGATEAGAQMARIATGAVAFAGFETFAGEDVSEAPTRALRGLAEGAAFEVAAIGVAKLWRSSFPKWKPTDMGIEPPKTPQPPSTAVHSLALKLENWFRPGADDSPELVKAKLREIGDPKAQLTSSFLKLMKNFMPGGNAVLPGLSQKEIIQLWKAAEEIGNITLRPFRRIKGEDAFDVLVIDHDRTILTPKLLSSKYVTIEEMTKAIKESFDDKELVIMFPEQIGGGRAAGRWVPPHFLYGPDLTPAQLQIATSTDIYKTYYASAVMLHEAMHHMTYKTWLRLFGKSLGEKYERRLIDELLEPLVREQLGGGTIMQLDEVVGRTVKQLKEQLKKTSIELITREKVEIYKFSPEAAAESAANNWKNGAPGDPAYYRSVEEMFSRASEMLLLDSKWLKTEAPLVHKIIGDIIEREGPKIRSLLSREAQQMLDLLQDKWLFETKGELQTLLRQHRPFFSEDELRNFGKYRFARGMRVFKDGKEFIVEEHLPVSTTGKVTWKRKGAAVTRGKLRLRDLNTGAMVEATTDEVTLPILQSYGGRTAEIVRAIDTALEKDPAVIPILIRRFQKIGDELAEGYLRAIIDTADYTVFKGTGPAWIKSLPREIQDRLISMHGTLDPKDLRVLKSELGHIQGSEKNLQLYKDALDLLGSKGLVVKDDAGITRVLVHDDATLMTGTVVESPALGSYPAGDTFAPIYRPRWEDMLDQILREGGVSEVDMEYYREIAKERYGNKIRGILHPEVRQVEANVKQAMDVIEPLKDESVQALQGEEMIMRAGMEMNRLHDGSIELRDAGSKSVLGRFPDEDYAVAYAREAGINEGQGVLADFPAAVSHGGGAPPPRLNDPVFPPDVSVSPGAGGGSRLINRLVDAQTIFGSIATALENFAKAAERRGLGPAYTKVYVPLHNAMLQVHRELSDVVRDALGGLTYKDKLRQISDALVPVRRKRYATVVGHVEALSKGEIAKAGGLMVRAMTGNEIRVAKSLEARGLGNDIPRLMSTDRLIRAALKGNLNTVIRRMEQVELSPEAQQVLQMFKNMPKYKTRDEIEAALGLTADESWAIKLIRDSHGAEKDKFSIYAVSRYASAPELRKGFKNGKEQFAFDNGMTSRELKVSQLVSETLEAAFNDSGLDPRRHLTGYWPHLRMWVREGFVPNSALLPEEVSAWVSNRFRSGELNVYETDPLSTVYKHLRGLYMKRHFDPAYKKARGVIAGIQRTDPRVGNVMKEYALELMGKPHASFGKLQHAFTRTMEVLFGKTPSPTLINDIISGLAATTSAAVIPFRPALIARNFFESLQKVAPRTGLTYYLRALRYVTSGETKLEAYKAAMDAGAIRPGVQRLRSLHAAEELFGPKAPSAVHKYLNIFDKGYDWYQSADDWGRAIAYHAQKLRIMDHSDAYMKGKINIETFLDRAKINTFDPLDVEIAKKLIENGDVQKATDHLGQVLSRETMTRYGYADHPAGWNSVMGRLFGQFGTWPVQYKDYLLQGLTRGSMKDRAEFAITHGSINGAIVLAGYAVGANLTGWTGMSFYTGGPYADMAIDVAKSMTGSESEKALARYNLYANIPILGWMRTGNPRSMFLPGSYLIGDLGDAATFLNDGEYFNALMRGSGIRVMRPKEKNPLDAIFD